MTLIEKLFDTLDHFKINKYNKDWEIHSGDIVINKKKYKKIKREFIMDDRK